jgi:NitT/TauT family transport system ATP-binding protein
MTKRSPIKFENTELPDVIELKNIVQKFGDKVVLDNFNLLIEHHPNRGQFVVVLGKSGCGKSTFLRYLAMLQTPTSGEVLVDEKPITTPIPMVFQKYSNLPWLTVLENVMLPLKLKGVHHKEQREKAMEMISLVGLEDHVNKFAQDSILSGGQMQRVAIARSLIADPRVLLMDEPFGALDIHTRFKMQILLEKIWEQLQSTVIFVTHDIQEAVFLGDDIYIMDSDPGVIVNSFHVDLPVHRTREIKKDRKYIDLVNEIDDTLFSLAEDGK